MKGHKRVFAVAQRSAVPLGLLVSAALVWQTSNAAFTATTKNENNRFASGRVTLADNDGAAAMFTLTGVNAMKPGDSVTRCIRVTYGIDSSPNLPMAVRMYGAGYTSPTTPGNGGVLGTSLNVTIDVAPDQSTWTSFPTCPTIDNTTVTAVYSSTVPSGQSSHPGKLEGFASYTSWSNGISGQFSTSTTSTSTTSRIYRITAGLPSDAPDSMQGSTAEITFVWEAQNS